MQSVRVLRIGSIMRNFLGIMDILGFCDFVIFPSRRNTLILQPVLCFHNSERFIPIHGCRHDWSNHGKTSAPYVDFFIFVLLN